MRRLSLVAFLYLSLSSTVSSAGLLAVSYQPNEQILFACVRVIAPGLQVERLADSACSPSERPPWSPEKVAAIVQPLASPKASAAWSSATRVATARGPVEMQNLKVGDYVISPTADGRLQLNAIAEVREIAMPFVAVIEIETAAGTLETASLTLESLVYSLKENAWKPVYEAQGHTVLYNPQVREGGPPRSHTTAIIRDVIVERNFVQPKHYVLVLKDKSRPYYFAGGLLTRGPQ